MDQETATRAQCNELLDDLWFGVGKVFFRQVTGGTSVPFHYEEWKLPLSDDAAESSCSPKNELLPDNVPNIPGVLPVRRVKEEVQEGCFDQWPPELLGTPLIKCKQAESTEITDNLVGRVSGVRSCVVKVGGDRWIRLKGSGNDSDGFIVRDRIGGRKEIRGCAFAHTALLECYNSELLARTLRESIPCNRALGWYVYPDVEGFVPVCIVEETVGDRRLGSHLLAGLEIILEQVMDEDCMDEEDLVALFPAKRRIDKTSPPHNIPTAAQLMVDYCLAGTYHLDQHGVDFPDLERDHTIFADCSQFNFHERTPTCPDPKWGPLWPSSSSSCRRPALAYLFSRLGADAGRFLRELHDAHYSWGTYADVMCVPGQLHCNAHSNNLVVLPEESPSLLGNKKSLLAYLDLDMAFPTSDEELLDMEHRNFAEVLVGAEMSSGVATTKRSTPLSRKSQLALTALQDLMLQSYLHEYKKDTRYAVLEFDAELHTAAYDVIKMALVASSEIVA